MRIGIDVMGGDNAPDAILDGAIGSLGRLKPGDELVLVGDQQVIEKTLADRGIDDQRVKIVGTTQVIAMDESPVEAVRTKKAASVVVLSLMAA